MILLCGMYSKAGYRICVPLNDVQGTEKEVRERVFCSNRIKNTAKGKPRLSLKDGASGRGFPKALLRLIRPDVLVQAFGRAGTADPKGGGPDHQGRGLGVVQAFDFGQQGVGAGAVLVVQARFAGVLEA